MIDNWSEWIGYIASIFVAVSLMMKSMHLLRWLNLTGAFIFVVYGFFIQSWPVVGMNAFLVVVNLYHLFKLIPAKERS